MFKFTVDIGIVRILFLLKITKFYTSIVNIIGIPVLWSPSWQVQDIQETITENLEKKSILQTFSILSL